MGVTRGRLHGLATLLSLLLCSWAAADAPRIAIVIDDLGYLAVNDRQVLALDARIAVAIIPDGPLAPDLSRQAAGQQREVLIHLPLAAVNHDNCEFEATCIDPGWSALRMASHLRWAAERVEHAIGLNNHQGSRFTADAEAVRRLVTGIGLLDRLHGVGLFVLDSRTTAQSVLEYQARGAGLQAARRNVFLDHDPCPDAIEAAWEELLETARRDGSAIAIGHPHKVTLEFLDRAVIGLEEHGIELVPISELLEFTQAGSEPQRTQTEKPSQPARPVTTPADVRPE